MRSCCKLVPRIQLCFDSTHDMILKMQKLKVKKGTKCLLSKVREKHIASCFKEPWKEDLFTWNLHNNLFCEGEERFQATHWLHRTFLSMILLSKDQVINILPTYSNIVAVEPVACYYRRRDSLWTSMLTVVEANKAQGRRHVHCVEWKYSTTTWRDQACWWKM